MRTILILLNIHSRILIFNPYIIFTKRKGPYNIKTTLSILLVMGLFIFNGPFVIWNSFMNFMSNKFNPPYIMPHVVFKVH